MGVQSCSGAISPRMFLASFANLKFILSLELRRTEKEENRVGSFVVEIEVLSYLGEVGKGVRTENNES